MLCAGQQLAYCVYLVALFHCLVFSANVYVFYGQINDNDVDEEASNKMSEFVRRSSRKCQENVKCVRRTVSNLYDRLSVETIRLHL